MQRRAVENLPAARTRARNYVYMRLFSHSNALRLGHEVSSSRCTRPASQHLSQTPVGIQLDTLSVPDGNAVAPWHLHPMRKSATCERQSVRTRLEVCVSLREVRARETLYVGVPVSLSIRTRWSAC